jgi:hypothetical protein
MKDRAQPLQLEVSWDGVIVTVALTGDITSAPGLTERLMKAVDARPERLVPARALPGQVRCARIHTAVLGTAGKCAGWSAAALRRQALGSVSGSFTPVRRRSPAAAGIVSALVTNIGGQW